MIRSIPRAFAAALFGALAGPVFLVLAYATHAGVQFPITSLPPNASGFYPAERDGSRYFVWTSGRATVDLPGLDRRAPWSCSVSFRGARSPALPQPYLQVAIDGAVLASPQATNAFQTVTVTAPARPTSRGLTLMLTASPTFAPGGADPRTLGVQIDDMGCHPAGSSIVLPPTGATLTSAVAGGLFGAAFGLTGITAGTAVTAAILLGAVQSIPLSRGAGPYTAYPGTAIRLAFWMALLTVVSMKALQVAKGQPLRNTAKFAVLFPAGVLYLKLLGLLHPSKPVVDAVFHAHRFDAVLAGRFYFTQLSTSATPFPYAIGLYLFAAPWSLLTADHVALLRVVVCACEAIAGGLLYVMVDRAWEDRLTAAVAVALVNLVPVVYPVVGNANLTYAFGQTVALATIATVTAWPLQPGRFWPLVAVILLASLGFISHISTLLLLLATLVALALLYWVLGGKALRTTAWRLVVATALAVVVAVALYWGHFPDVYKAQLTRARPVAAATPGDGGRDWTSLPSSEQRGTAALGRTTIPLIGRVLDAGAQTVSNFGWPLLILAALGAWLLIVERRRDRVALAIAAWTLVGTAFVAGSVLTAVDKRYQQDAWEFIGRVEHTTAPAIAILAALGAMWAWRERTWTRIVSAALLSWAVVVAIGWWAVWF